MQLWAVIARSDSDEAISASVAWFILLEALEAREDPVSERTSWMAMALAALACGCAGLKVAPERDLSDVLRPSRSAWNEPVRMTARAGGILEGDYYAPGRRLVFCSRESGDEDLWLQENAPMALEPPRRLASDTARDTSPRFSPDGRRVLFASGRDDAGGDLWTVTLVRSTGGDLLYYLSLGGWLPFAPEQETLQKLTGLATADDQPCWDPSGKQVYFASAPSLKGPYEICEQSLRTGKRAQLTEGGAQMPDCSPDGRILAFVSKRRGQTPGIYVTRFQDGAVVRLSAEGAADLFPCWSADGRQIYFTRYALDTNGDGRVDTDDAAAVFSVTFKEDVFGGGGKVPPARQLTSWTWGATRPRPLPDGFLFTSDHGPAGGSGTPRLNLWALASCGESPDAAAVSEFVQFARGADAAGDVDRWHRMLAWQNALWAARESSWSGRVRFDLARWGDAAEAAVRLADLMAEMGFRREALDVLARTAAEFPNTEPWDGLAAVRRLELIRDEAADAPPDKAPDWEARLQEARAVLTEYGRRMAAGDGGAAADLAKVAARAHLEVGRTLQAMKRYPEAVTEFKEIPKRYPEQTDACAQAMLAMAEVFRAFQQPSSFISVASSWSVIPSL